MSGMGGAGADAAGPADPGAGALPQDRVQRADQAAGAAPPLGGAVGRGHLVDRQAIGDHDESSSSHQQPPRCQYGSRRVGLTSARESDDSFGVFLLT